MSISAGKVGAHFVFRVEPGERLGALWIQGVDQFFGYGVGHHIEHLIGFPNRRDRFHGELPHGAYARADDHQLFVVDHLPGSLIICRMRCVRRLPADCRKAEPRDRPRRARPAPRQFAGRPQIAEAIGIAREHDHVGSETQAHFGRTLDCTAFSEVVNTAPAAPLAHDGAKRGREPGGSGAGGPGVGGLGPGTRGGRGPGAEKARGYPCVSLRKAFDKRPGGVIFWNPRYEPILSSLDFGGGRVTIYLLNCRSMCRTSLGRRRRFSIPATAVRRWVARRAPITALRRLAARRALLRRSAGGRRSEPLLRRSSGWRRSESLLRRSAGGRRSQPLLRRSAGGRCSESLLRRSAGWRRGEPLLRRSSGWRRGDPYYGAPPVGGAASPYYGAPPVGGAASPYYGAPPVGGAASPYYGAPPTGGSTEGESGG